ncbi:hypothetical protein IM792_18455 [Mucilaginibacter sp. JRF]|uniref:glycosylhydrolase-like jelly roll fold domain-containing protein n=1 Tax=Mucilaginibacter sp. JRF TaxID=2780088 RepID=UPI0018803E09|nr:glycosylhydrolase-like jelly roll fold domain-containing protein [Mucilaginibacter sp. JRF]MBE9586441.1 hypothetical protein [Mucilaginibacter sp. JRF]
MSLSGSWQVAFDTQWGGPANTRFPSLISWTESGEEGIKYYSGTAKYSKSFKLSGKMISSIKRPGKGGRLFIDLGDVKNVAEVKLNGKKLGVLWCAPWRVDATDAIKAGNNVLEIAVTNLWANRVVHDLSLPPARRLTKTHESFRFDMLNVNTPILPSGLLGSVTLQSAQTH